MVIKNLLLAIFLLSILLVHISGQTSEFISARHDLHKIDSKILKEERKILVRTPANYHKSKDKYPVLYMLDAHSPQNAMMVGLVEQQSANYKMPEMIVVGIQNTNRGRDMTPPNPAKPNSGGGAEFLDFIEKEVMPMVEKDYCTQPYKIFAGWSSGGLMVLYSLVSRPEVFDAYISVTPYLAHDDYYINRESQKLFAKKTSLKKSVFVTIADEPNAREGFIKLKETFGASKLKEFEYDFKEFLDENHGSVVLPSYYWGLRKVFNNWELKTPNSVSELETHHKKLSKKYGFKIPVAEASINQLAYRFFFDNKREEAIKVFAKNVEKYPNSTSAHFHLARAYERVKQTKKAREVYKKAYDIAVKNGNKRLMKIYKAHVERLTKDSK